MCAILMIFVAFLFFLVAILRLLQKRRALPLETGFMTRTPVVPLWLQNRRLSPEKLKTHWRGGSKVKIVTFDSGNTDKKLKKDKKAIIFCQKLIDNLPPDTITLSVAMRNFKCGQEATEFEPICGRHPRSYHTYQMFSDNRIQITKYVEEDVEYVAGYCIYIESPYHDGYDNRVKKIIEDYSRGRKYKEAENLDAMLLEPRPRPFSIPLNPLHSDDCPQEVLSNLKSHFCVSLQKPVLIGLENGQTWHYEWIQGFRRFGRVQCDTCRIDEEAPPSYESIFQ